MSNLTGGRLALVNLALSLGTFIQVLDTSIANVAIPYIAGNLGVSADEGTWVITSFAASNAIVLPLTGWLSNYFGRVRLFVWSVFLFSLMSFLCGFSSSLTMLVLFRVMQGAVAGSLIPLSQSLLMISNPVEKQGSVMGLWAMVVVVAPVIGPIVGGYLTETYSWRWIFYINVPIGILAASTVAFLLKDNEKDIQRHPIDWLGLLFLSIGVGALQVMLDKGKDLDWFGSNIIIGLTIAAVISLTYFTLWSMSQKHPIVDFSFLKQRNFALGSLAITLSYFLFFSSSVTVPLWLQTQQNYTAFWAGVAVAPIGIIPVLFSTTIGSNLHRFDLRAVATLSMVLFSLGFFYQSNFTTEVELVSVMLSRFYQGFGMAVFFLPITMLALSGISKARYASAAGLYHFIRILVGSGFGTSLSIEVWWHLQVFHHARLSDYINSYRPVVASFYSYLHEYSSAFNQEITTRLIDKGVEQQAYMLATNDLSWASAWLFLLLIPVLYSCKKAVVGGEKTSQEAAA